MDMLGHLWAWWNAGQGGLSIYSSNANFFPFEQNLLSTHGGQLDVALGAVMLRAGVPPVLAWNLLCAGLLFIAAFAGFRLGFRLTGAVVPAMVGALGLAWAPQLLRELAMGRVEQLGIGMVGLCLVAVLDRLAGAGRGSAVELGLGVVLTTLMSWELGVMLGALVLLVLVAVALRGDGEARRGALWRVVGPCLVASVVLLPLVVLFAIDMDAARRVAVAEVGAVSDDIGPFVQRNATAFAGWFLPLRGGPVVVPCIGLLAMLGLGGPVRRAPPLAVAAGAMLVLSLGSVSQNGSTLPLGWLQAGLPFLDWLYFPERFALMALVPLAGLAALGTARLVEWSKRWAPGALGVALILAVLASGLMVDRRGFPVATATPLGRLWPIERCIDQLPEGALIEVPLPAYGIVGAQRGAPDATQGALNVHQHWFRYRQLGHGRALLNGVDVPHVVPAGFRAFLKGNSLLLGLATASSGHPELGAVGGSELTRLRELGLVGVVVHEHRLTGSVVTLTRWLDGVLGEPICTVKGGRVYLLVHAPRSP
jgi:hypothetical protein